MLAEFLVDEATRPQGQRLQVQTLDHSSRQKALHMHSRMARIAKDRFEQRVVGGCHGREQQIDERLPAIERYCVEQIGILRSELVVDEAARTEL